MRYWAYRLSPSLWLLLLLTGIAWGATFGPPGTPLETCNRADEDPIGNGQWTTDIISTHASTIVCSANLIDRSATAGDASSWWHVTTYGPDVEVALDLPDATGGNTYIGVYFRLTNPGTASANGYTVWWNETTAGLLIRRLTAGGTTLLTTTAVAVVSGDSIGASAIGDQICSWHKPAAGSWTQVACVSDPGPTGHSAAGYVGIFASSNGYGADNFWARTVPAGGGGGQRFVAPLFLD